MMTLWAPAKLNLFLHVVGRRSDGYHLLQSLFCPIDWLDRITLEESALGIYRGGNCPWPVEDDLAYRAAMRLREEGLKMGRASRELGCMVSVHKGIPTGAGLGGGSSDAATVLMGLNRLWGLGLTAGDLARIGLELGADVPFFVFGESAFVEGIGEQVSPMPVAAEWFLVAVPPQPVPTVEIFRDAALTRNTKALTVRDLAQAAGNPSFTFGRNDLQPVAFSRYPALATVAQELLEEALAVGLEEGSVRMSGSGGAIFCSCRDEADARRLEERLTQRGIGARVRVCRHLHEPPAHLL